MELFSHWLIVLNSGTNSASTSLQVIADIDNDGVPEMIVAVSYFFDRE